MADAKRDANRVTTLLGVSTVDGTTPVKLVADPATGHLQVDSTGGGGGGGDASAANQTSGNQKTQIVDGSGNVIGSTNNALNVNLKAGDISPASQNITVIDTTSSTATGANNQSIIIGTPTAGSAASFALSGIETVRVEVTGIWTGTVTAEQSIDGGITWTSQGLHQGAYTTASFTAGFIGGANMAGATNFRMRATAAITGTAVVNIVESTNTQSVYIANAAPAGTVISTLNSSTATLTSGSTFTGTGEDVANFSEIRVSLIASHVSATDGLSIQQSSNNTNWDIIDTYTIPATTGKTFVVPRQARYFRVVYTNGGTNQSSFRLQSILNRTATASSSQRAQDAYSNENDLEQVWSFSSVWNGSTWDRMSGDTTGINVKSILAVTPGTGAGNLGKAEDTAHSSGDVGVMALAVRNDAGAVLAGSDGDYVPVTTDSTGALRIDMNGTVSSNNSTTATLTANSVFTGTSDDAINYNEVRVSLIASHASATDGLSIQQSSDNTNWDIVDTYTIPATTGKTYSVPRQARYVRIVYANGAVNQTSFRMQTILNRIGSQTSSQRPSDGYTNETDLEQQQSFLMGFNGTTWDRIRSTIANGLSVDVTRNAALVAGTAVIGKVGIDQTTPGTTNAVAATNFPTTVDTNSGVKSASTLRVVLATDQPALTNKLLVTPDSVALPANQSVNVNQLAGTTTDTNSGVKSAGTLRVVLATDQPALTNKLLVTPDSVALPANQSINLSQVGGTTTVTGGVAGTLGVGGNVATNVAIGTNPINLGAQAVSSENGAVTTARMVQLVADLVGKLIVLPYANPENEVHGTTAAITDTTSTSVIASAGGSLKNYVTDVTVSNSHATVGTFVKILEGSNIIDEGYAAAAGGGFTKSYPVPRRSAAATAINAQCVTTGANVIVSAGGYKGL